MASVWDMAVFEILTIEFQIQNGALTVDAFGNERPSRESLTLQIKARSAAKKYRDMLGIAEQMVLLDCRCVDPEVLPNGLVFGSTGVLELGGVQGVATLEPLPFTSIKAVEETLGQRIFISWRAA